MNENSQIMLRYSAGDIELKSKQTVYHGFFKLEQYQVRHRLFNGGMSELVSREIFERGDAVVLMPYDPNTDSIVMIEQFRPGAIRNNDTPWLLEFVAGMFSANESPIDVAIREAKEEANLDLTENDISPIMNYLSSPGGMSEQIHLLIGIVDSKGVGGVYGLAQEHEDILVHVIKREEAMRLLLIGKITNASTIIGLQWLQLNYKNL
ncbi:NUDIX domain-containing protein [Thalassotalea profundi]|uniref:ADP-ribose pyrophosphatase n=1 Tax=Thalassotalea profundi TaxID=2036687 RepID=A0ABQ3IH60_9GAMM|nr:NUDIX domain-containing protein [Thalassotalea profundi]GHE84297.1 ADP-ribose diphosphatase [Thalassotalea profundi]